MIREYLRLGLERFKIKQYEFRLIVGIMTTIQKRISHVAHAHLAKLILAWRRKGYKYPFSNLRGTTRFCYPYVCVHKH